MGNVPPSALRQPPPPRRCLLIDSTTKAEADTSRVRSRPFYFRRSKKANPPNSMIDFESLPDELLIEILLLLSADEIYDNARLVCRRWRHLIQSDAFVHEHLHRATSGLLLKPVMDDIRVGSYPSFVSAMARGRVETSKLSCRINFPILCSCNGLALCLREADRGREIGITPFIFNPATKCAFNLPRFKVESHQLFYGLRIAYAAASMAYKVVGSYHKSGGVAQCGILTVGVDNAWRNVVVEGLSPEARRLLKDVRTPLITGCFVHWVSETHVLSLNVETECFTLNPTPALMFPPDYQQSNPSIGEYIFVPLSTGEYISLFVSCGDWSWEVWEMKPETWEWRKFLPKLDLEAHKFKIQRFASTEYGFLKPVGWVRYPMVLAFDVCSCFISYNLDTEEINTFNLSTGIGYHYVVQHRNSLVWSEKWLR